MVAFTEAIPIISYWVPFLLKQFPLKSWRHRRPSTSRSSALSTSWPDSTFFAPAVFPAKFSNCDIFFIFKILLTFTFISKLETMGEVLHFISVLFCSLVLLEQYITHPGYAVLRAPVQGQRSPSWTTFWRLAPLRRFHECFSGNLYFFFSGTSRPCSYAHSNPCSRLWGSLVHHLLPAMPCPFLPERYFFTVNVRYGLPYRSNQLHQGPAKARNSTLQSASCGHEPCCASRDCSPSGCILLSWFHSLCFLGGLGFTLPIPLGPM